MQYLNVTRFQRMDFPPDARERLFSQGLTRPCDWDWDPKDFLEANFRRQNGPSKTVHGKMLFRVV